MLTVRYSRLEQDTKHVPDGQIFTVFTEQPPKPFVKTEDQPHLWAFCFKMKGQYAFSSWANEHVGAEQVKKSQQQILYARRNGWSGTSEERFDDVGEKKKLYRCLYCGSETLDVQGPCICRRVQEIPETKPVIDLL